jgi:uncharacterized protein YydD (DUF2326 family)
MLIERLIVRKTKPIYEVIRNIPFKLKGLSLIVDSTSNTAQDSGNNVGKTTAIKIIDLCLGGKSVKTLYFDDDTKSENVEIKKFLNDNKVEAELVLVDEKDIGNKKREKIIIIRQLYNRGKRIINGEEYTQDEFWNKLKIILFDLKEPYPTLRQLIPKFIRINDTTEENMIKYLPGAVSKETYDTIYLFLFNFANNKLLSEKDKLTTKLAECQKKIKLYEKDDNISSLDSLKQRKQLVDNELNDLMSRRKNLDYIETYKKELQEKSKLKNNINELEEQIQLLEFDVNLINKNIQKLKKEKSNIDVSQITNIYNESEAYIGELHKTFQDVVRFHNAMIENRINFIKMQLEPKEKELKEILKKRDELLNEKKNITIDLLDEGLLEDLNILNSKIEKLDLEEGEINQSIKILDGVEDEKEDLIDKIKKLEKNFDPKNNNKKISVFNSYFSDYCQELYNEKYFLVYNNNWKQEKKFPVYLDHFKGNVGTGMKKGVIVAFDLAYMKYSKVMNIKSPQFVIHDKLENTHINQLRTIFDLCKDIDGQYIVPILRERVDKVDSKLINQAKVLELSKNNKFFKI